MNWLSHIRVGDSPFQFYWSVKYRMSFGWHVRNTVACWDANLFFEMLVIYEIWITKFKKIVLIYWWHCNIFHVTLIAPSASQKLSVFKKRCFMFGSLSVTTVTQNWKIKFFFIPGEYWESIKPSGSWNWKQKCLKSHKNAKGSISVNQTPIIHRNSLF